MYGEGAAIVCRFANTEQRYPTGFLSLVIGWPHLKSIDGELVYLGPLPRVCPCTVKHHESLGTSSFNSSTSLTMGYSFWHRIFSDFWSKDKFSLRVGGTAVHDVPTASLADAVGSWQPLFEHWKQGKLTRRLLSEYTGSQDVERFLCTARAVCPAHSVRSSLSLCCSSWSSRGSSLSGGVSPGYAHSDDTFSPVRSLVPGFPGPVHTSSSPAPTASSPTLSSSTTSQTTSRTEAPLASSRQRDMPLMAMAEVRTWLRVVV